MRWLRRASDRLGRSDRNGTAVRYLEIPGYVDPAVLEPGAQVECVLDGTRTPLTVLRVEPALICATPDGTELVVLAHTAVMRDE